MADEPPRKVEVEMKGSRVTVVINCADHYAAILLFDQMAAELRAGYLELQLEVTPAPADA